MGTESFYKDVYMTNLSWFGFTKDRINLNYNKLPEPLQNTFTESFISEMDIVQPKVIIPLSMEVEMALKKMKNEGRLSYPLAPRLPHPYYCSIGKRAVEYKDIYINQIELARGSNFQLV